jgi:hypothetical protein
LKVLISLRRLHQKTVRLMLILSIILGISTRQVDYMADFVQAPIDKDPNWDNLCGPDKNHTGLFLDMPGGFKQAGKVLKLNRTLYRLRQAPRKFFQNSNSKLEAIGFESQENIDNFLFISNKVIILVYFDDTLLFSPDDKYINDVISKLQQSDMELEVKDSVGGFLGQHIKSNQW